MTYKLERTQEFFGSASAGYLQPHRYVFRESAGGNTDWSLLKQGILAENPYTFSGDWETTRQVTLKDISGNVKTSSTSTFGCVPVFDYVATPDFGDVVPKLLEKWRSSEFNLGVSIGEGRESVEMIIGRLADITKAAVALRRGNLGGALRHLSHVPKGARRNAASMIKSGGNLFTDVWLEIQYGWIPLIKDIGAAAEFVKLHPKQERVKARAKKFGGAHPLSGFLPPDRLRLFDNVRRLQLIVVVSSQPTMMERLGLTDPKTIMWELTPFSFVMDWFAPIGDYLQTLHAVNAMPVVKAIQTYSSKQIANVEVRPGDYNASFAQCLSGGTGSFVNVQMSRTIQATMPLAWAASLQHPRGIIESWDPDLKRLTNAATLAHSVLRGASGTRFRGVSN